MANLKFFDALQMACLTTAQPAKMLGTYRWAKTLKNYLYTINIWK
jgi:hypothetical protein